MNQINYIEVSSPFGKLILGDFQGKVCLCDWKDRKDRERINFRLGKWLDADWYKERTPLLDELQAQLEEYWVNDRDNFDLPLLPVGTEKQKQVWEKLEEIPYGETRSYSQLADALGNPKSCRAVASAVGANPLSILIPCHRIIGKHGALTGYAGGLKAKEGLLNLERA